MNALTQANREAWSPAREVRARCSGGCKLWTGYSSSRFLVETRNGTMLKDCPRCLGTGVEPSAEVPRG